LDLIIMNAPILVRRVAAIVLREARCHLAVPGRLALAATLCASIVPSAGSFATTKVAVKLQGDIVPKCSIGDRMGYGAESAVTVAMELPDITKPGRKDYEFRIDCNAPFAYRLEAKYGALTRADDAAADGFSRSVPYDVAMYIPTDGGTINDRCSGESIRTGQVHCPFSNSGNGIALAGAGNLTLAWATEGMLLAGKYTDRLTIIVGVRP
jgi:hypothetical protein